MTPTQVQQFLSIVKHRNMTTAAKELFVSQSALSQSLSRMEGELGVRLFYRDGSRLVLSREGEELLDEFHAYMQAYNSLLEKSYGLANKNIKQLKIGYYGSALRFASFFISGFFSKEKTGIDVTLTYAQKNSLRDMLMNEQIDLAISSPPISNNEISCLMLPSTKLVLAVPLNHPLAQNDFISINRLKSEKLIKINEASVTTSSFEELCRSRGIKASYAKDLYYDDLYPTIAANAYDGEYVQICQEDCFDKTFFEGYKKVYFEEKDMTCTYSINWLEATHGNYQYKEIIDYIVGNYDEFTTAHAELAGILAHHGKELCMELGREQFR